MRKLHKKNLKRFLVFVSVFVIFTIFSTSVYAAGGVLDQVKSLIKSYYVYDVPQEALNAETVEDAVKALNDPYSEYFSAEEFDDFINSIDMKFLGIGINLEIVPDGIKVVSVMKGQPAETSGITKGDIIISADGHSLKGMTSLEATSYIRGEEGTVVKLVVKRGTSLLNFSITRKIIEEPTVMSKVLEGNTGYIGIASFGEKTPYEFKNNLMSLKSKGVDGYIVDLRNNGGGYMNAAVNIAEYFIGQRISLITENKNGNREVYSELDNGIEMDKPVIFLINENSASASEILSAAVKDYSKAFFVGKTTYGKGVAQSMFSLSNGGVIKLTTMKFYSPKENIIHKKGISPDLDTGDMDALLAAELLLGKSKAGLDKRGYIKVSIGNRSYDIDINRAKKPEYNDAFKCIMDLPSSQICIGTQNGWQSIVKNTDEYWNLYFCGNTAVNSILNVPTDKKFMVSFSKDVSKATVNGDTIKLVRALTGEKIPVKFEFLNGKQVKVLPEKSLNAGENYYLVIDKTIKSLNGSGMARGTVTKIKVEMDLSRISFIRNVNERIRLAK